MLFMCQVRSRVMAIVVQVSDMTLGLKLLLSVIFRRNDGQWSLHTKNDVCPNNSKQPV